MSDEARKPKPTDLLKLPTKQLNRYPNWYYVPTTWQLVWRGTIDGKPKTIRTGVIGKYVSRNDTVEGIQAARAVVEEETKQILTGKSDEQIKREKQGVTNPLAEDVWTEMRDIKIVGKEAGTVVNYDKAWKHGMRGFWGKAPTDPEELARDREEYPHTIPTTPFKTVADLTTDNIVRYKAWYLKANPKRLFDKTFDFMKMYLRYAAEKKYISEMPNLSALEDLDEIIKKNKQYKKAGRVYTPDEERSLLTSWPKFLETKGGGNTSLHKRVVAGRARTIATLGLRAGMREDEILSLIPDEHLDFKRDIITVWSTKNHKWREIPMVPIVREALLFQIEANKHFNSKWLFPMPTDPTRYLSHQLADRTWNRLREYAGIEVSGPYDARGHDCRKTFAVRTAEWGWPPKVACEILDMTLDVYEKVYATEVSFEVKAKFMLRDFGGAT